MRKTVFFSFEDKESGRGLVHDVEEQLAEVHRLRLPARDGHAGRGLRKLGLDLQPWAGSFSRLENI